MQLNAKGRECWSLKFFPTISTLNVKYGDSVLVPFFALVVGRYGLKRGYLSEIPETTMAS